MRELLWIAVMNFRLYVIGKLSEALGSCWRVFVHV